MYNVGEVFFMKKLFLILVSVLLLGGCSVDDDISASGGGVSNGGDDMAITTYPNVVEASRTVVEGGYLVEYVYDYDGDTFNNGLLNFVSKIWDIIETKFGADTNASFLEKFSRRVFNVEFNTLNYCLKLNYFTSVNSVVYFYFSGVYWDNSKKLFGCILEMPRNGVSSNIHRYLIDDTFVKGKFTIFEPSN